MPFVQVPGLNGKVYTPQTKENEQKKYPCKDCFSCQMCSEDRCNICRSGGKNKKNCTLPI